MKNLNNYPELKSLLLLCLLIGIISIAATNSFSQSVSEKLKKLGKIEEARFIDVKQISNELWRKDTIIKGCGWKPYKRWENFWETRTKPDGTYPNIIDLFNEYQLIKESKPESSLLSKSEWRKIGPSNRANLDDRYSTWVAKTSNNLGRINVVRFHPQNHDEIWAGASTGGVWKTTDAGITWFNFPFTAFLSLGVSDIAFSPTNPDIVYVATGDHLNWGETYSIGIIKTIDGGKNWEVTNFAYELSSLLVVCRLLIHPDNPNNVIAATSNGIYKTTDGGASWTLKQSGYFKDMEFMPGNPDVVNAATFASYGNTALFRSGDNGETWQMTQNLPGVVRTALAVTPANPQKVYAICTRVSSSQYYYVSFHSFMVSSDGGQLWTSMSDYSNSPNILGSRDGTGNDLYYGQAWYDLTVGVSPFDENEVFIGGINIWKSQNGGSQWELATHGDSVFHKPDIHVDQHDIVFRENSNEMFVCNDGGLYKTTNNGSAWEYLSDGMSIAQFYRLGCDASNPDRITAGSQDNGSKMFKSGEWIQIGGADGMETACDYSNPDLIYLSAQNGLFGRLNTATAEIKNILSQQMIGEYAAWTTPFVMDPMDPSTLYAGYTSIWKSIDKGDNWKRLTHFSNYDTFISLAVAPSDTKVIYAATYYNLYLTTDGGQNWIRKQQFFTPISYIAVSFANPSKFWVSCSGFDEKEKVWEYDGANWINLTGNLPNVPVNTIVCQKDTPEKLYIGTDIGVFYSENASADWSIYGEGLPNLIISELEIQYPAKKLRAATYGMGIWEADIETINDVEESGSEQSMVTVSPNPFNQLLIMNYELRVGSYVSLKIYDMLGNDVATLVDEFQEAGRHNCELRMTNYGLASGMYYYRIQIGDRTESGKLLLIR